MNPTTPVVGKTKGASPQRLPAGITMSALRSGDLIQAKTADGAIKEAARVLKPHGLLAVIEFKKIDGPPGPPIHIRLLPQDVESIVAPFGFNKKEMQEVGAFNYLITFHLEDFK